MEIHIEAYKMTIKDAEKIYKKYNCSKFAMARDDLLKYQLYEKLNYVSNVNPVAADKTE